METPLSTLYRKAHDEESGPMRPSDAARLAGMSPRTVFRFLKAGQVKTPCGDVPFKKDAAGCVSVVRLEALKVLRQKIPLPGRKYGRRFRQRRGSNINERIKSIPRKKDNLWRLQRILAMIDQVTDKDAMQTIRARAAQKYHRL